MTRSAILVFLMLALAVAARVPNRTNPVIDIRDPDGNLLVAAADLVSYDSATHTMTLKDGAKEPFAKALKEAKRFAVRVAGKPAVEGRYIGPASPP